jgi:hypothetical protein
MAQDKQKKGCDEWETKQQLMWKDEAIRLLETYEKFHNPPKMCKYFHLVPVIRVTLRVYNSEGFQTLYGASIRGLGSKI